MSSPQADAAAVSLLGEMRRNGWLYAAGTTFLLVQQSLLAGRDLLVRSAVEALERDEAQLAARVAMLLFGVSVVAAVARLGSRAAVFTAGRNGEFTLRGALLRKLHRLGPSFFGRMPTGEIMSRATNDLHQVRLLLGFGALNVASSSFALASALFVMFSLSWRLTVVSLCTWPLLALVTRSFSWRLFAAQRDNQQALGEMSDRVLSSLAGVRVVRSFAMEREVVADFDDVNRDYLHRSVRLARLRGLMAPIMTALSALGLLVVFWYGGSLLASEDPAARISMGDFVAFWLALLRLGWPILAVGFVTAIVQRGRASYRRLQEVLEAEPDVQDGAGAAPRSARGAIRVSGLSASVGSVAVLHDVSFELSAGESLAIIGRTGSGKSTLAAVLARLAPAERGQIYLDDVDVCDLPLDFVRRSVAYVPQDAFLFSTTVAENVAFGIGGQDRAPVAGQAPSAPDPRAAPGPASGPIDPRIVEALRRAQVLPDVEALADGFDTVVGERGIQLSGGQRQRVALARALVKSAPVLLLDDPMSAVDARTEAAIMDELGREIDRRTVVLITHRVAAAQRCARILVLDQGRVVEHGTHAELMAAGSLYALFAAEQQIEHDFGEEGGSHVTVPSDVADGELASGPGADASGGTSSVHDDASRGPPSRTRGGAP